MDSPILSSGQSNSKFLTLSVLPQPQAVLPIKTNLETPLFNELYLDTVSFETKIHHNILDPKRIIPVNIDEWSTQNKIIKPKAVEANVKPPAKEKVAKKQFIEIDLLYGDVDRMLVLLRFCYPQLNDVPENELRDEIDKFLKHLTIKF